MPGKQLSLMAGGNTREPAGSSAQADIDAIARVIRAETLAFQNGDFEAWSNCWVHDARTRDVCVSDMAGLSVLSGWAEVGAHMKQVMEGEISCGIIAFRQNNLDISVAEDMAWAVFEGWSEFETGGTSTSFETRVLEKHRDGWRIVYSSFVLRQIGGQNGLELGVDGHGRILEAAAASSDALKQHPYLTVSAGRLKAHRRDWGKALQAALSRAAEHHGFFKTHQLAQEMGGQTQYPVILGQADDGGVAVIHLSIRDCGTFVRLDDSALVERRLGHAQRVFDISDGQINVARHIALGKSLKETAEELGVTVNTARTHLARLYDKTGVGTQAALVRLLLSVG